MKKKSLLLSTSVALFSIVVSGCKNNSNHSDVLKNPNYYESDLTDAEAYAAALPEYEKLMEEADSHLDLTERYVSYAKAEAYMLDQAVLMPTTTEGGTKTISRIVPRTVPYVYYGSDGDKFKGMKIVDDLITAEDREKILAQWEIDAAYSRTGEVDKIKGVDAVMEELGYIGGESNKQYKKEYNGGDIVEPNTLDYGATSYAQDIQVTANIVDGLVEHDCYGNIVPAIAESWTISEDGKVYTFKLREDVKWVTNTGSEYAIVDAYDFVDGFQHMLDADGGTEKIVRDLIEGVDKYLDGEYTSMTNVGVKAKDQFTLEITLVKPAEYFLSVLTFNAFLPINREFFLNLGGAFGISEFRRAKTQASYSYGRVANLGSILYCGAYTISELRIAEQIVYVKNNLYYDLENVTLDRIVQASNIASNPTMFLQQVIDGLYVGCGLSTTTLPIAEKDPVASKCIYVSDNQEITFYTVFNLNRRTYGIQRGQKDAMVSSKTDKEKDDTRTAILNKNFRKAVLHAFDKIQYNLPSTGPEMAAITVRNMYVSPDFLTLPNAFGEYAAGTNYATIVQDELTKLKSPIKVRDGQDGWYNVDYAKQCMDAAVAELGDSVSWPIKLDVLYISSNDISAAMATAVKKSIQDALGRNRVLIELVNCSNQTDYLTSSFLITEGSQANYDLYYGSGWAPDYADPRSYLDTILPNGRGYISKNLGLW